MELKNWWNDEEEKVWKEEVKRQVMSAFANAEKLPKPNWIELFTDIYDEMPKCIEEQVNDLKKHLDVYKEHYPMSNFKHN
jgi:2-oxoisovalerate dehydrogenase E1 component alpha subunit